MKDNENKKVDLLEELTDSNEEITNLIEKYDAESRYRTLKGLPGKLISLWLAAMSLFHLATAGLVTMPLAIQRAVHLTFAITAVFILYPATRRGAKDRTPWYDWLLAAAGFAVIGYIVVFFNEISRRGANPTDMEIYLGIAASPYRRGRTPHSRQRAAVPLDNLPRLLLFRKLCSGNISDQGVFAEPDNTAHVSHPRGDLRPRTWRIGDLRHRLYHLRGISLTQRRRSFFQ